MDETFYKNHTNELVKIVEFIRNSNKLSVAQQNPSEFFAKFGIDLPANYQYELYLNDDTTLYMVVPPQNNKELASEILEEYYAGGGKKPCVGTTSSYGCLGTLYTLSCLVEGISSTFSSFISVSSAGTISSARGE